MLDLRGEPGCWAFTLDLTFRETLGFGTCKSASHILTIFRQQLGFKEHLGKTKKLHGDVEPLSNHGDQQKCIFPVRGGVYPGWLCRGSGPTSSVWKVARLTQKMGKLRCTRRPCLLQITSLLIRWCLIFSRIYPEASFESKATWDFSRNLHIWNANAKHGQHGRWALPHRLGITLWTNQVNTAETLCTCCYPCPYQVQCKMRLASSEMLVLHRKTIHIKQRQETPWVDL